MQSIHKPQHKSWNLTLCVCVNKKIHLIFFPSNIYFFKRGTENRKRNNLSSLLSFSHLLLSFDQFLAEVLWRIVLISCQLYGEGQQMAEGSYCFGRSSKEVGQSLGWGFKNENGKWAKINVGDPEEEKEEKEKKIQNRWDGRFSNNKNVLITTR